MQRQKSGVQILEMGVCNKAQDNSSLHALVEFAL